MSYYFDNGDQKMDTTEKFILDISKLKCTEFPLDEFFALQINHNNVKYEFLVRFSSKNKNLICLGSGAYNPKDKISPPIYHRHSWQNEFEESVIYYNDPTLYNSSKLPLKYNSPKLPLGWGIGKLEEWYLLVIADIIRILTSKNDIKSENILFFGSSGGGFTSIILATLIKNSAAMVNNPQMFCRGLKDHFDNILNACFDNLDLKTVLTKYGHRLDVAEMFKYENYVPPITCIVNVNSEIDLVDQLIPFINSLTSFKYFDYRINILLYPSEDGHEGVLNKEETIKMIKNHFNNHDNSIIKTKKYKDENNELKNQLEIIANTRPYRIAYTLRRFSHEFLNGNKTDRKNFLKWIYCKLMKKESGLEFMYNPLLELVKK